MSKVDMSKITLGFITTGKSLGSVLRNGKPTVFYIEEEQSDLQNNHAGCSVVKQCLGTAAVAQVRRLSWTRMVTVKRERPRGLIDISWRQSYRVWC